jgi:hypothetical protein
LKQLASHVRAKRQPKLKPALNTPRSLTMGNQNDDSFRLTAPL